jgi:hypothetical protein
VIDPTVERSVRLVTTEGAIGEADVTIGIDLDAAGDETKAMFTLNFDPEMLSIDGTSYPAASPDITLGADAPAGMTLAVNATEAGQGRITVLLNFNGPVPSGLNKRIVNLVFHTTARTGDGAATVTIPETGRQMVNGVGDELPASYQAAAPVRIALADPPRQSFSSRLLITRSIGGRGRNTAH